MSIRRVALDVLTRPRLQEIARKVGIDFPSNAPRNELLDRMSRSHSISFKDLLAHLLRDELKLACQRLGLKDTGRERRELIHRIIAADRLSLKERVESRATAKANVRTTQVSRSRGTSNFLNGVSQMDEPKIVPSSAGTPIGDATHPVQERDGVVLNWGGKRTEVERIVLPFQRIEVVNESRATREAEKGTFLRDLQPDASLDSPEWRNKLIWGDNKYALGSLLEQFAGKVDLIYIDPPFGTGQNFSFTVEIGDEEFTKDPSLIEEKAYRDTWGRGVDSYLSMMYERLHLLRQLLSDKGSIFVHLDVHMGPYIKVLMDEVFGQNNFQNEIAWYYYNKLHGSRKKCIPKAFDQILYYVKNRPAGFTFHTLAEPRDKPVTKLKYSFIGGKIVNDKDDSGKTITYESTERQVDNVWRIRCLQPANKQEWVNFDT